MNTYTISHHSCAKEISTIDLQFEERRPVEAWIHRGRVLECDARQYSPASPWHPFDSRSPASSRLTGAWGRPARWGRAGVTNGRGGPSGCTSASPDYQDTRDYIVALNLTDLTNNQNKRLTFFLLVLYLFHILYHP